MAYETRTGMRLGGGGLSGKNHGKHGGSYGTHAGFMGKWWFEVATKGHKRGLEPLSCWVNLHSVEKQ